MKYQSDVTMSTDETGTVYEITLKGLFSDVSNDPVGETTGENGSHW